MRLEHARRLANIMDVFFEEDSYDHKQWLERVQGLEHEPEKGKRCEQCFTFSLERTARMAERLGYPAFATTLTLSPHKVSKMIFEIGRRFPGYVPIDFKKEDGFLRSLELSRAYDLYRQGYCGCEFSRRET